MEWKGTEIFGEMGRYDFYHPHPPICISFTYPLLDMFTPPLKDCNLDAILIYQFAS